MFEKKHQISIYVVATMLLVDFALFGYLPSHNRIRSLKAAKADQRAVVATATHRAAELPEAQARLEALKEQVPTPFG